MCNKIFCFILSLVFFLSINFGYSQLFPNCPTVRAEDFNVVELFSRRGDGGGLAVPDIVEPVQISLNPVYHSNGSLHYTNVFFVERAIKVNDSQYVGRVKMFHGLEKKIYTLGQLPIWGLRDNGMMGVAVHPNFAKNRWIYLWYSPRELIGNNRQLRLHRFEVRNNRLDPSKQKILINILGGESDKWHSGGAMAWDDYGDLWIAVGNNSTDHSTGGSHLSPTDSVTSDEWGASNTASMRGSILRIHPDSSQKGYSIPYGNFGEYWSKQFKSQGREELSQKYLDPKLVLPEVYTKGHRSNFSIGVHPRKRWLAWGEVNYQSRRDEFNVVTHPVFAGYPYFHANQERTAGHTKFIGFEQDPDKPMNLSPLNSGVQELPPAYAPNIVDVGKTGSASHMTGPIYRFNRALRSDVKFPEQFNNYWFTFDAMTHKSWMHLLNNNARVIRSSVELSGEGIFKNVKFRNPLQGVFGAEGALYILNYSGFYSTGNPSVVRVDYVGNCKSPIEPDDPLIMNVSKGELLEGIQLVSPNKIFVNPSTNHSIQLLNLKGQVVYSSSSTELGFYDLQIIKNQKGLKSGIYVVRILTQNKIWAKRINLF